MAERQLSGWAEMEGKVPPLFPAPGRFPFHLRPGLWNFPQSSLIVRIDLPATTTGIGLPGFHSPHLHVGRPAPRCPNTGRLLTFQKHQTSVWLQAYRLFPLFNAQVSNYIVEVIWGNIFKRNALETLDGPLPLARSPSTGPGVAFRQGFSACAPLTFWAILRCGGCAMHRRMCSSVPGLRSQQRPPVWTTKNVSRQRQMSPGGKIVPVLKATEAGIKAGEMSRRRPVPPLQKLAA